jgi:hypothetical protein
MQVYYFVPFIVNNRLPSILSLKRPYRGDPLRWLRDTLYPQKLALTSPTSGGRSVSIVRLRTKVTEFKFRNSARNIGMFK